ncbi:MAG: addiction module toxin, HicA family [Candidatus Parabeggiatoa sp. nov. 3]|nr:MAG: addiction module toxin, HicA family [Gammaproteobacteria bacterium]RKZ68192.1 MAG: addiction module toxin, HicA family [Gammaproteobacteria bacterium]RKZ85845.1 MAG: addiction module toxin, HicA family [Gammaproteobacteria bacterium]
MKRRDFLNYLSQQGCQFVREGSEHSIWEHPILNRRTSVPRHREIPIFTVTRICKQLGISAPSGN